MTDNGRPEGSHLESDDTLETRVARALGDRDEIVAAALRGDDARDSDDDFVEGLRSQWLGAAPALAPVGAGGDESVESAPRAHWTRRRWVPMAAAAALLGAVTIGFLSIGDRGGVGPDPGREAGPSDEYLTTDGDAEIELFDGTVDWGDEAPAFYDVVVRDADPLKTGEDAVFAKFTAQEGTPWHYPDDPNELPELFTIEAYDIMVDEDVPAVRRSYRRR